VTQTRDVILGASPRPLFSWDVPPLRTGGVSDDPAMAAQHLVDVLQDAPAGAEGSVHRVVLSSAGSAEYVDLGEVARARRAADGDVIWRAQT
jgi:hypothetical protein